MPAVQGSVPDDFVGRIEQLELLRAEGQRARAGAPRLVLLEGAAGIGKTRLVTQFLAEEASDQLLRSSGDEAEMDAPYGVVSQLVHGHPLRLDGLGTAGAVDTFPHPHVVGVRLLELLGELQDNGPVTMLVDDAHWADSPSLAAVVSPFGVSAPTGS